MRITVEFSTLEEFADFVRHRGIEVPGIKTRIKGAGLTVRTENLLQSAGIEYIEDAQGLGLIGLLKLPNMGRKSAGEIMEWGANETAAD